MTLAFGAGSGGKGGQGRTGAQMLVCAVVNLMRAHVLSSSRRRHRKITAPRTFAARPKPHHNHDIIIVVMLIPTNKETQ